MQMNNQHRKILLVDDEWESAIIKAVHRRLEDEGWSVIIVQPESKWSSGDDFDLETMYVIEEERPDGVLLDVRFGEHQDDRFRGLAILQNIVERFPKLPILMFTQYVQGPERETAARGALRWNAPVDFIDKLASPEEVVLRLRRMIGTAPETIYIGDGIQLNTITKLVNVTVGTLSGPVTEIQGMKFEILAELANSWYRSPGEVVPFSKLERYFEGGDYRASLRVRIREIKDAIGLAMGRRFGPGDLIVNVRDQGYRLTPPIS